MSHDLLIARAGAAALCAYAPYSRFSVGCAIESVDGEIAVGANMENACYRLGICAEVAALTAADKPYDLAIFPEERHMPRDAKGLEYQERRIYEYFRDNL